MTKILVNFLEMFFYSSHNIIDRITLKCSNLELSDSVLKNHMNSYKIIYSNVLIQNCFKKQDATNHDGGS